MGPAIAIVLFVTLIVSHPVHREMVVLLPDSEGKVGTIVVETEKGEEVVLNSAYASARSVGSGVKRESVSEEEVKQTFESAIAAQPPRPASFTLYFESGTDEFTPESKIEVQRLLEEMARRGAPDITVIGHTDLVGDNQSNDELSLQRAERVKKILMGMGIPADRILVAGRGKREPIVSTAEGTDEPRNRRVEVNVR